MFTKTSETIKQAQNPIPCTRHWLQKS